MRDPSSRVLAFAKYCKAIILISLSVPIFWEGGGFNNPLWGSLKLMIFSTSQGYWKVNETADEKYLQKRLTK